MPWVFVLVWSTGFIVARYGMPHSPPMTFLAWRFALSVLGLALWAWLAGALSDVWGPRRVMLIGLAVWGVMEVLFLAVAIPAQNYTLLLIIYGIRGFGYPLFAYGFLVWVLAASRFCARPMRPLLRSARICSCWARSKPRSSRSWSRGRSASSAPTPVANCGSSRSNNTLVIPPNSVRVRAALAKRSRSARRMGVNACASRFTNSGAWMA